MIELPTTNPALASASDSIKNLRLFLSSNNLVELNISESILSMQFSFILVDFFPKE